MIYTIIIFLAVLALLVLAHELGHYFTARKFGAKVEEFGFGFPPRIKKCAWQSKKTGIIYSLNWIPLGGFVKIKGEDGDNRNDSDSFGAKPVWQRAIMLVAGVTMNIVLAIICLSVGFGIGLPMALPDDPADLGSARVRDERTQIYAVSAGSPAETAGLKMGDAILNIDGQEFTGTAGISEYLAGKEGKEIAMLIDRATEQMEIKVTPEYREDINRPGVGIGLVRTGLVSYPWYLSLAKGAEATWNLTAAIVVAFYNIIKNLIFGAPVDVEVAGPVGIAVLTGQAARMGWSYILQFIALLSINLAIINILPLPALDGGRLLFLGIEKIRRQPVNQVVENWVHSIGFMLLMLLMVFVTYRDVVKWGGGVWAKIFG